MSSLNDLPSLNALRSFVLAAQYESFSRAARDMHVTPGAVNRLVRLLEEELGVRLFERSGRSIKLTALGASYLPTVREAFDLLDAATHSLRTRSEGRILRINAPSTFALRWLLPRLPQFQNQYPDILVDVTTRDGIIDLSNDQTDIAIVYSNPSLMRASMDLLMTEEMGVFCSPNFLKGKRIRTPSDLKEHLLLHNSTRPEAWPEYFEKYSVQAKIITESLTTFEHFFMIIEAAIGGMGVAILPRYLIIEELISNRLVQVLKQTIKPSKAYYIAHAGDMIGKKAKIFKEWILKESQNT